MSGAAILEGPWPADLWELEARLPRKHGEPVTARDGETLLLDSVGRSNWPSAARELLARGVDIHCRTSGGSTPLHEAAWHGNVECLLLLLEHGANIEAQSHTGRTALHNAVLSYNTSCVRLLVERGANLAAVDNEGISSLALAQAHMPEADEDDDDSLKKAQALTTIMNSSPHSRPAKTHVR